MLGAASVGAVVVAIVAMEAGAARAPGLTTRALAVTTFEDAAVTITPAVRRAVDRPDASAAVAAVPPEPARDNGVPSADPD